MRIACLTTDFGVPVFGNKGAAIHFRAIASAFAAEGHQVEILATRAGGVTPDGWTIPVHEIALDPDDRRLVAALQDDPEAGDAIAREIRSMVHTGNFIHRAWPILERFQPDAIYERHATLGITGSRLARELGIPHILEVNAPLADEHVEHRNGAFGQTLRAMERRILASADRVVAVSEPLRQWIVAVGIVPERVVTVPNGVDLDRFAMSSVDLRSRLRIADQPVIGFTGTLKPWHGTATLIRAFAQVVPQREVMPHLLIVGDGPCRADLEQLAAAEGVAGRVTFAGMVPHESMPDWLQAMSIAVVPYDELPNPYFSPLKLFEYMAASLPIVAAAVGQVESVVRDGETGLLYPPGDVAALADRLRTLLDAPERAAAIGRAARVEAKQRYGWDRAARTVTDLIGQVQSPQAMAS